MTVRNKSKFELIRQRSSFDIAKTVGWKSSISDSLREGFALSQQVTCCEEGQAIQSVGSSPAYQRLLLHLTQHRLHDPPDQGHACSDVVQTSNIVELFDDLRRNFWDTWLFFA
jgi:hypothetical protein